MGFGPAGGNGDGPSGPLSDGSETPQRKEDETRPGVPEPLRSPPAGNNTYSP
jgi:hypothetical protein